jgi:hypothetical protein
MYPQRLFKKTETVLQDMADLQESLDLINQVCAKLYYVGGMTDACKDLCNAFYKLRIKIIEMGVQQFEDLKASNDELIGDVDMITRLANSQAELDIAKEDYDYFLRTAKIKEE